ARGGAGQRSHAVLGDLLRGGQPGRRLTPLRGHSLRAGRPGRARHRADRRPGRLGESPGLLARELTASRDDERAALLPWARQARPRPRSLSSRGLVTQAGYPGTRIIPAVNWLLSLLAPKLTRTRRVSHVDDLLADPAAALPAGLTVLPKKSALTSYS